MAKYNIRYYLQGFGTYYVEAPSITAAIENMYDLFQENNMLVVHAEYDYGFEIKSYRTFKGDMPNNHKYRVTTAEQRDRADKGEVIDEPPLKPWKIACPELFDFDYKPDDEQK